MPGPGNKRKAKAPAKAKAGGGNTKEETQSATTSGAKSHTNTSPTKCLTLEEDEVTRCGHTATEGYPKPDRCKVHHGQYRTLYKKYKDASKVVDDVKNGAELPTKEHIGRYTDWHASLEKARWVLDDGHRRRLKLLEREMVRAVDVLDALQRRAYGLYQPGSALHATNNGTLSEAEVELEKQSKQTTEELMESARNPRAFRDSTLRIPKTNDLPEPISPGVGDEDLIDMSLRDQKERIIKVLEMLIDFESFLNISQGESNARPESEHEKSMLEKQFFIYQQFARRIIFHEPTLFMKSLGKVSFKDLILSDDFSMEDLTKFLDLFLRPMEFPLKWFKDAVLDALAISRHGTAANIGSVEDRFPLLGGWVFNRSHTARMPNEAWWLLLKVLQPPADVENRFVRLCNNFEDLVGFLSFAALGLVPNPTFCQTPSHFDADDPGLSRKPLSQSGIIVADMVSIDRPPHMRGPVPSTRRPTQRGCIVWAEVEARAYMFGAVRHERHEFVEAFLRELRARPDLFQVVLRSDTDPARKVEMFGSGPSNNEALPAMRARNFEAPFSRSPPSPPSTGWTWQVALSVMDVLYGTQKPMGLEGYLTALERQSKGWFFRFKTFPVTYFLILDTVPYRDQSVLARNVAWAALRAGGYADGEYTLRKYAVASDKLFARCARERLGWMPEELWETTKLQDQI
ncbi:hypothetical protein L210DRAFT_3508516 [Boletus edulis BED1]|uniref:Uncharacterized protein n=1 Tax=Boletus edulis BED1 TaxID=1328754 RepID=A0AAD4BGE9_BOLED|nr:hypothetical protein L210DRAFT_3508516 [Boletus edulis BED1]